MVLQMVMSHVNRHRQSQMLVYARENNVIHSPYLLSILYIRVWWLVYHLKSAAVFECMPRFKSKESKHAQVS